MSKPENGGLLSLPKPLIATKDTKFGYKPRSEWWQKRV